MRAISTGASDTPAVPQELRVAHACGPRPVPVFNCEVHDVLWRNPKQINNNNNNVINKHEQQMGKYVVEKLVGKKNGGWNFLPHR